MLAQRPWRLPSAPFAVKKCALETKKSRSVKAGLYLTIEIAY